MQIQMYLLSIVKGILSHQTKSPVWGQWESFIGIPLSPNSKGGWTVIVWDITSVVALYVNVWKLETCSSYRPKQVKTHQTVQNVIMALPVPKSLQVEWHFRASGWGSRTTSRGTVIFYYWQCGELAAYNLLYALVLWKQFLLAFQTNQHYCSEGF